MVLNSSNNFLQGILILGSGVSFIETGGCVASNDFENLLILLST